MVGLGGLHSHFRVQPNYSIEVVLWLCCVVVGVVTKMFQYEILSLLFIPIFSSLHVEKSGSSITLYKPELPASDLKTQDLLH